MLMKELYNPKRKFIRFGRRMQAVMTAVMAGIAVKKSIIMATKLAHLSDNHCVCVEMGCFAKYIWPASTSEIVEPYVRKMIMFAFSWEKVI